jgi:hypothetical protein
MSSINQYWAEPMYGQGNHGNGGQNAACETFWSEACSSLAGMWFAGSCVMMDITGSGGRDMFMTWNVFGDPSLRLYSLPGETPWTNLGGGTMGSEGKPVLIGAGTLEGGTPASVTLMNAPRGALLLAWISLAPTPFSALGGTVHAYPYSDQLFFLADSSGSFTGGTTWPTGIAPDTNVWFQFLVEDDSTVYGITLSNGLLATTP